MGFSALKRGTPVESEHLTNNTSFWLVPKSLTVNDLERRHIMTVSLRYFTEFSRFESQLRQINRTQSHIISNSSNKDQKI